MSYSILFLPSAYKELKALPKEAIKNIDAELLEVAKNPDQRRSVKVIHGFKGFFRLRVGKYRLVFTLRHTELVILVVKVGHRKDVYDALRERIKSLP